MEDLFCLVERITYRNEENGYTVLKCRAKGFREQVTAVGILPNVATGMNFRLTGDWRIDPKYGRQFSFEKSEEEIPATAHGIERYLGSGLIKGIGPKFAAQIVAKFGEDTLRVIEEEPERLLELPGIGKTRVEMIRSGWEEQREIRNIMLFLQGHDVSVGHAAKIFRTYGSDSVRIVTENPYRLADDIWGIGFLTADRIAMKLGFGPDRPERIRSGIIYVLNRLSDDGHCYGTRDVIISSGTELLKVEDSVIAPELAEMIRSGDVMTETIPGIGGEDTEAIYLPALYRSEIGTSRRIYEISKAPASVLTDTEGIPERISMKTGIVYDDIQAEAVKKALTSKFMILTGGPGTGKTTTTTGIIEAFRDCGAKILLCAPTGRAAKRMTEATGTEAKTVHRLLEVKPPDGYNRDENNPLSGDVLIVDECSMIDIVLMYHLLKAVPDSMTVILVGDMDQLPSVGPGTVLRDMIDSGTVPVVRLERIFRQAMESRIITNAHRINRGVMPDLSNGRNTDFFFSEKEDPAEAATEITELVSRKLPGYFGVKSSDIQVLTPMRRGEVGSANLNRLLQDRLNPKGEGIARGGYTYRQGDRVMQIRNNYEKEVFNGDIGTVGYVNAEEGELIAMFDGRSVSYEQADLDELVLAYAATVHKSQGSEYPVVVMPVMMTHYIMLQRNLLYTGVTRAKRGLVIVGTKKAVACAVKSVSAVKRNTMLDRRLRSLFGTNA